ncbi:MAG: tetratricopeptide repeat protein [Candidatus Acidiferrales bacterium]
MPVENYVSRYLVVVVLFLAAGMAWLGNPTVVLARDGATILQSAQKQFNAGNYSSAITTLQSGATQNPDNAEIFYWLGRNYYELRDYENAIAQAEKSVQIDPKNSLYHMWLGRAYGEKADREHSFSIAKKVKKEFQDAVRLNPSNLQARRDLEEYDIDAPWIVGGNKDEAKAQVEAIAAIDPVEGRLARAVLYLELMKKPDLAEHEYREVLKAAPDHVEPYIEVANFFVHQNKAADVDVATQAAAKVAPSDARLGMYRGVWRVIAGTELPRAEEYLKSYLASTPDRSDWPSHASAREWLGRLYEAEGKRTEAAEQYRAALQLDPGRKEARARLQQLEKKSN